MKPVYSIAFAVALGVFLVLFIAVQETALAGCDPNEECSRCLLSRPSVHIPFNSGNTGGCIQHGNDPICEARKAACRQCGTIAAASTGLSLGCAYCVIASTAANPTCAAICGGAAQAKTLEVAARC